MPTTWNQFQKANKGKGFTPTQISQKYKLMKLEPAVKIRAVPKRKPAAAPAPKYSRHRCPDGTQRKCISRKTGKEVPIIYKRK
jgi:hypothetical protein